jgi:hypothetical protein
MEKNNVMNERYGSHLGHHVMKQVKVVILIGGLILGVSLLANVALGDITYTEYLPNGYKSRYVEKSDATGNVRVDCRSGGMCRICGECHTSEPQSAILSKLTQASWDKHVNSYFPKQTHSLPEGKRLSWDREGSYYINQRNRLLRYSKDNKLVWTAPTGSRILKNKRGEPFAVLFSGEPSR